MTALPALPPRAALAAAFGLGAAAAAGQAPWGLWWLALPAFGVLALVVAGAATPRRAAWLGWAAGCGHFALALFWIVEPFLIDAPATGWMAPFALVFLAAGLALFWAAAAAVSALARARVLAFALALAVAEGLRGVVLTGFPWALPGHIWIDTPFAQLAALVGPDGLTLVTLALAVLPAALGRTGLVAAAALLTFGWGWGALRPVPPATGPVIRLVQPAADQQQKWQPGLARALYERLLSLTAEPAASPPALVIWPETALPYLLDPRPGAHVDIAAAAGGVPVALGAQRSAEDGLRYWNSLALLGPAGDVAQVYDKHHLVPFGEYIPFGDRLHAWFGLTAFATQLGYGYSAGPGSGLIEVPGVGTLLPLICYEAVFPAIPLHAPARPRALLNVTNDAWFGTLTGPQQHFALARLRAIEQGLPLLRAANTGISAVIDARGRVVRSLGLGQRGVIDAALPAALPPTPFARWGRGPVWLLLALSTLALVWHARAGRA